MHNNQHLLANYVVCLCMGMIIQTSVLFTIRSSVVVMQMPAWMTNKLWDIVHSMHTGSLRLYWCNYQREEGAFLCLLFYCSAHTRLCVTSISSQNQWGHVKGHHFLLDDGVLSTQSSCDILMQLHECVAKVCGLERWNCKVTEFVQEK